MYLYYGYAGKVLNVDLSTGKLVKKKLNLETARTFIGGLGFNAKILYDEAGPTVDPFSSDNIVAISPGALTGTTAPASYRTEVTTKSPLTGIIGTGNAGGYWGPALKRAGYDTVIIRNGSEKPVFLWVNDDEVELKEATHLWGKDTWDTTDALMEELGQDVSVMAIGPAGENLVRFAAPVIDKQHMPGRCHAGAVMGAKKLKAIAVRGTKEIAIKSPEKFDKAVKEAEDKIRSYPAWKSRAIAGSMGCFGKGREGIEYEEIAAKYLKRGPKGCYCPCMMEALYGCNLVSNIETGKYAGTSVICAGLTLYSGTAEEYMISLPAAYRINELCQQYGMDMSGPLYFALELYKRRIITKEDTDGLELTLGNDDALMEMLGNIAYRSGFGDILAEGTVRAAEKIGRGSERYLTVVKGLEAMQKDPRASLRERMFTNMSILVNPRGGDDLKGTHGLSNYPGLPCWALRLNWDEDRYLDWLLEWLDMFDDVKDRIFGVPPKLNDIDYVTTAKWYNELTSVYNSLGICMFAGTVADALGPTHFTNVLSACTGWNISPRELMETGERIFNLMRAYLVREGLRREHDQWPATFYEEPSPEGPEKGPNFSKETFDRALDRYYEMRGWDKKTGIPTWDTLIKLKLGNVANELLDLGHLKK